MDLLLNILEVEQEAAGWSVVDPRPVAPVGDQLDGAGAEILCIREMG